MQRFVYLPCGSSIASGRFISISDDPKTKYVIGSPSGIGIPDVRIIETTSPAIHGSKIQQVRYEPRVISDIIHIRGGSRTEMYENRKRLNEILSPDSGEGTLFYTNNVGTFKIRAIAQVVDSQGRVSNYNKCRIEFYCADPYWRELKTQRKTAFSAANAGWTMGSFVSASQGVFFAASEKISQIYNAASASTPVKITINGQFMTTENGYARIINHTTGQHITISQDIDSGNTLIINTEQRNISVLLDSGGDVTDAFSYIDPDSDLSFHLAPGTNLIEIACNVEQITSSISVEFVHRHIGL